jgi:hypothetical protein
MPAAKKEEVPMRKINWIVVGLLGTAALLGPQVNSALGQEALKIGVPTALTGTYAGLGNEARRAIEFASEEANAKGGVDGRKVEIKVLDTEAKPEVARQQAEKLAAEGLQDSNRNDRVRRSAGDGPPACPVGRALRLDDQQKRQAHRRFLRAALVPREQAGRPGRGGGSAVAGDA